MATGALDELAAAPRAWSKRAYKVMRATAAALVRRGRFARSRVGARRSGEGVPSLEITVDKPSVVARGIRFRLLVRNDGRGATFAATAERTSGGMPSEPPAKLAWEGDPAAREARIKRGEVRPLRLAIAHDVSGPTPWFGLTGVNELGRQQKRRLDDDVTELTVRVRNCDDDRIVLEQPVWLSYTIRGGEATPIATTVPPVSPLQRPRTPRAYLGLEISDRNLRSTIEPFDVTSPRTSQQRYGSWREPELYPAEYLLPHIDRCVTGTWPAPFMVERRDGSATATADVGAMAAELGPWSVPFRLRDGISTMVMTSADPQRKARRIMYRRDLVTGTVAELLGAELATTTVLDIGCNSGFFSLDMAHRGAQHVDGIDLRDENIAQAEFLANHYGLDNVSFRVLDADALPAGQQWDVVLNLGVLYHVVNPLQFLQQTYALCRRFAIIDTICHTEPVSAFVFLGNKNTASATEGRETWEFHPTYRGAIDAIRYAGFSEVVEVLGYGDVRHELYDSGGRRCFLAIK